MSVIKEIQNTKECFVQLWLELERTRQLLFEQCRRYSIRNVLKSWLGEEATDDFIWDVCYNTVVDEEQAYGMDLLPPPALDPRIHREFLIALVGRKLGLSPYQVNRKALDAAYSEAYPESEPLNIGNRRTNRPRGKREKKPP